MINWTTISRANTTCRCQVGSMLRTPRFPVWVTKLNGSFGLLFSINPDLVCDWRVEHRFQLHYFTALKSQTTAAILLVGEPKQNQSCSWVSQNKTNPARGWAKTKRRHYEFYCSQLTVIVVLSLCVLQPVTYTCNWTQPRYLVIRCTCITRDGCTT